MPSRSDAFAFWLKLGFVGFGGPAGQIALMHEELVVRRRWISERRFLHALNYCMVLPGPEAQQLATYLGWLMHRTWGGVVAGSLFVLPSLIILVALSWLYLAQGHQPVVAAFFDGLKPAVTALVLHAAWRIGSRTLKNAWLWAIALASWAAVTLLNLPFPLVVLSAAAVGLVAGRLYPAAFGAGTGVAPSAPRALPGGPADGSARVDRHAVAADGPAPGASQGPSSRPEPGADPGTAALIDDHTPAPDHARWRGSRFAVVLAVGLGLWGLSIGTLLAVVGRDAVLAQMAGFFSKAALVTFGGAYAVLPYVYQAAVEQHQWLTGPQMMDGLALGETTPGPLIMVVAFVGFVGGWTHTILGPDARVLGGTLAAVVATYFTFLPSFFFILLGGPFIESTRGRLGLTAALTAITAAVVGVIVSLALVFAEHVLWPRGLSGPVNAVGAGIGLAAALALFRLKWSVVTVVLACGLAGVAAMLVGLHPRL